MRDPAIFDLKWWGDLMDKKLLDILVCPLCKGKLLLKAAELICRFDKLAYPIRDNIPVMLEDEARAISLEEADALK